VVEFRVLGPLEVYSDDTLVHVGGVKQRSILALLIANRGGVVSTDRIVDEVYGEDAAAGARRSVQTIISMLRRDLGDVIVGSGGGYRFDAARNMVDVCRFEDLVAEGLALLGDDPRRASSVFDEALGLWRGDPYGDVEGRGVFQAEIARLSELRFTALEARAEADLGCGRHREVVAELEALVGEYPLRERLWGWLMLALYRTGRQADALAAYQQLRQVLGEGLGIEPCDEVRVLEEQILLQDPALDLVPVVPHNLPASLTSFVGRDLELIEIGEVLEGVPLVTLTGTGGSGKTRLAIEFARRVLDDYPDGVWFVDFRGVGSDGVASLVASTSGVVTSGDRPLPDQVVDALWSRRSLLVLDNCEHVLDAVAPLVEDLLRRDGPVRLLATSREPLGVPGEPVMLVDPLRVPERPDADDVASCESVLLFTDRAQAVMPEFVVDEHVEAVFGLCRAVEGLPLGLELAAARLRVFSPEEVAERLDDQLATLKTTQRAGDLRHATIEATIRWSWELLDDAARTLLSRLSVFQGTWALDAAETVCGFEPIGSPPVADLVESLVDKSLVVVDRAGAASTRYRLLEPIRQYASHDLDDEEAALLRHRLVDYWTAELEGLLDPDMRFEWHNLERARAFESDQANLTAAVEWALAEGRFEDAMVIFGSPFGDLLMLRGSASGLTSRWMEAALEHREEVSRGVLLRGLSIACSIANLDWRPQACLRFAEQGIELSSTPKEQYWFDLFAASATNRVGHRWREAEEMFERIAAQADDPALQASALLAKAQYVPPRQAWTLAEAAMELSPIDSLGWWEEGIAAWAIGEAAAGAGRYDVAVKMEERAVELGRQSGWVIAETTAAAVLAWLYAVGGRLDEAAALINDAVPLARRMGVYHVTTLAVLITAADIERLRANLDSARRYVDEAEALAERGDERWVEIVGGLVLHEGALIARDEEALELAAELLDPLPKGPSRGQASDMGSKSGLRIVRASVELRRDNPDGALEDLAAVMVEPEQLLHSEALEAVDLTAIALAQRGQAERAAQLKGAVDRERDECGLVIQASDLPVREAAMRHAQSNCGDWATTVLQGRSMTLEEALYLAAAEAESGRKAIFDSG
jgi:predicted ATPase/DNA-binding SARP family transcriptional activator